MCIGAYTTVLLIEFLPVVMERFGRERARRKLDKLLFVFVAVGVLLPTMHQSSLGSLLIVFGPQVSPLYQTVMLPLLFLLSCVGMGLAAVVFEGTLSSLAFHRPLERELLGKLMAIAVTLVAIFMIIRWVDLRAAGPCRWPSKPRRWPSCSGCRTSCSAPRWSRWPRRPAAGARSASSSALAPWP